MQDDHLSGKPGNVRKFDSCQGNVRDFTENQGIVREKILSGKSCQKLYCKLHICVHPYRYLVGVCCVLNGIWFWIMYCCIPTPATDSNTRTGMI